MGWFSDIFGGSKDSTVKLPKWYEDVAKETVDTAKKASEVGYVPFQGADVAAFAPQQKEAMQGAQNRFTSFNDPGAAIPQVQDALMPEQNFGGGLKGYSSFGGFQTEMAKLEALYPGIAEMLRSFSKSPYGAVGAPRPTTAGGPGSFGPPGSAYIPPPTPPPPPLVPPVVPPIGGSGRPPGGVIPPVVRPPSTNLGLPSGRQRIGLHPSH